MSNTEKLLDMIHKNIIPTTMINTLVTEYEEAYEEYWDEQNSIN